MSAQDVFRTCRPMVHGLSRGLDVLTRVGNQQKLWTRLLGVSGNLHQSGQASSEHILKRPVEPGPEDCCQVSKFFSLFVMITACVCSPLQ